MERLQRQNPFEVYRPELMVDEIIDYFVEPHFLPELVGAKPIMLVGAKGTGKTTIFEYLSYDNQKKLFGADLVTKMRFIGIYWKIDINYVSGFQKSNLSENDWVKVFGHYVNIILCLELTRILLDMQKNYHCIENEAQICIEVGKELFIEQCNDFMSLFTQLKKLRNDVERYVNNIGRVEPPVLSMVERGHQTLCELLSKEKAFSRVWFYFLIDEYENLLEYQQKIFNTLIKHSKYPYSFKVCRRSYGAKTYSTSNPSETLSDPADYTIIDLSVQMADKRRFAEFSRKVCEKRLNKISELKEQGLTNIDYFLPGIKPVEEAKQIEAKKGNIYIEAFRKQIINDKTIGFEEQDSVINEFINEPDPIIRRLCLSILQRGKVSAMELLKQYRKFKSGKKSDFTEDGADWIHNYSVGILFLLCDEYSIPKKYCGFDIFVHLSFGIIRYVLELCYVSFNYAQQDGAFTFTKPEPINYDIQNKAAQFVADKHLSEISTYPPYGELLKTFALSLGKVFEQFHKDPKQSEPERNQFTTDLEQLTPDAKRVLESAVLWSVLQELKGSKDKSKTDIRNYDYMLHPIYSPRFQISPYQGRKIKLSPNQVNKLLFEGEKGRREILRDFTKIDDTQPGLFEEVEDLK